MISGLPLPLFRRSLSLHCTCPNHLSHPSLDLSTIDATSTFFLQMTWFLILSFLVLPYIHLGILILAHSCCAHVYHISISAFSFWHTHVVHILFSYYPTFYTIKHSWSHGCLINSSFITWQVYYNYIISQLHFSILSNLPYPMRDTLLPVSGSIPIGRRYDKV